MTYYPRNIDSHLLAWKDNPRRKPLLLRGARQIGKSSTVRHLGETFKYFIELNFESRPELINLFANESDVHTLCERISLLYGMPVVPGETLLFLDEVQASPAALKSLWFFREELPGLHVIAAGSLLEFALRSMPSYGVGRVSSIFMYPMAFNEFLHAMGKEEWARAVADADSGHPLFEALYKEITTLYRTFLMVGGMPASVDAWVQTRDFSQCVAELSDIQQTYYDDFSKYHDRISPDLLRDTLRSVVMQSGSKFSFGKVHGDHRSEEVRKALDLLAAAGLIKPVRMTAANGLPLGAEVNDKFTRYIYLDTGLMLRVLDLDFGGAGDVASMILIGEQADLVNKGKVAELSAGWELVKASDVHHPYELYYWENLSKGATSEVDYVIPHRMQVLPIEVKAGTSGKMKSLRWFMAKKGLTHAVRTSLENFGTLTWQDEEGSDINVSIIPVYALGRLTTPPSPPF